MWVEWKRYANTPSWVRKGIKMILRMRIYVLHALFGLFGFSDDGEHKGR